MKLALTDGTLYIGHLFFCYAETGNGRTTLRPGQYPVSTQFSHTHGRELPLAQDLGWIGDDPDACDIVLCRVLTDHAGLPSSAHVSRLLALIEATAERGAATTLVIE
jgi:hypothetical protein